MLTGFGAVHYENGQTFHAAVAGESRDWLRSVCGRISPAMVSDNIADDFMWIAGLFDRADMDNPFGHSGRRISDDAGLTGRFGNTQAWKRLRVTPHDHNPVNDAMGNVEAFRRIQEGAR